MEQTARVEHWICRRQAPRFRLGMPARLITLERHLHVTLVDLSEGGAKVTLPRPHAFTVCVLRWMDYHAFAEHPTAEVRAELGMGPKGDPAQGAGSPGAFELAGMSKVQQAYAMTIDPEAVRR